MDEALRHPVAIVGVIGGEAFGRAGARAIAAAEVLVGSPRHLAHIDHSDQTQVMELTGPLPPLLDRIGEQRHQGRRVCVIASGDPGFFGIARVLSARLGPGSIRVHPAPSSVALAFASQGWSWDDAVVASAHGRSLAPAVATVAAARKAAVLTDPGNPPEAVGVGLLADGCRRQVVVVSRVGETDESTCHTDVEGLAQGRFDPMSVVLFLDPSSPASAHPSVEWGRHEDRFAHRNGMITKAEVRAVALGKLALPPAGVLWDVGAGSGSVGIEAAALAPALRVFSIERDQRDAERISANASAFGADVEAVVGEAPGVLATLPDPDRVFIGGGGFEVLDASLHRLRPGGVVVATYVLMDRALAAYHRLGNMVQVRIDRCVPLGGVGVRMEPVNPVFVCWGPA
jgi:precorrin-6Y C5,15-methyltransferase (decarboxylating)